MNDIFAANVKCPYFISAQYHRKLSCENCIGDGSMTIYFDSDEQKSKYIQEHCYKYPNKCSLCIASDKKYGEK